MQNKEHNIRSGNNQSSSNEKGEWGVIFTIILNDDYDMVIIKCFSSFVFNILCRGVMDGSTFCLDIIFVPFRVNLT